MLHFKPDTGKYDHVVSADEAVGERKLCAFEFCRLPVAGQSYCVRNKFYCSQFCLHADTSGAC
jgi:hypothetical protein